MRKKRRGLKVLLVAGILLILGLIATSFVPYLPTHDDRPQGLDPLAGRTHKNLLPDDPRIEWYREIYPMRSDIHAVGGYPIFEFYCDQETTICVDGLDQPVSSYEEAAHMLPQVHRQDVESREVECTAGLCYDALNRLIGSDPRNFTD